MKRLVLLGLLATGCGGAPPRDRDLLREVLESTAPPAQLVKTAEAEAPPTPAPPTPPPPEPVPEQLGTPASSLAAVPRWAHGQEKRYAPQPGGIGALFDAARASGNDASAVACRLSVGNYRERALTSSASLADISVRASFTGPRGEKRPLLIAEGADDDNTLDFLLPLAPLKKGDEVVVEAINRNVVIVSPDFLGHMRAVHRGNFPLEARGRIATLECRAIPRAAIERHFLVWVPRVDAAIAAVEAQKPDLFTVGFGLGDRGDGGVLAAREEMDALAGLTGWDDARVLRRVARLDAAEARIAAALAAQADALRPGLAAPGNGVLERPDELVRVRAGQVSCGPEVLKKYARYADEIVDGNIHDTSCVVRMDLTNVSSRPITISTFFSRIEPFGELTVLSKSGGRFELLPFGQMINGKPRKLDGDHPVAPGQTITLLSAVGGSTGNAPADAPMLLRIPRFDAGAYDYAPLVTP